jgi:hypothetical protein
LVYGHGSSLLVAVVIVWNVMAAASTRAAPAISPR